MKYFMKYSLLVLCLVSCVKCENGNEIVSPTPVLEMPARIQTTHQLNPLKLNVPPELKAFTTAQGVLLNPTPISKQLLTTGAAQPWVNDVPAINQLTTTFIDNRLVNPTPVLNMHTRLETGVGIPITTNLPLNQPLMTTGVVGNGVIKPSLVVIKIGTTPAALALTSDEEPESRPVTGVVDRNLIEPSQVSLDVSRSVTQAYTSQLEQEPEQVATKSINDEIKQNVDPCKCKNSEDIQTPGLSFVSYNPDIAAIPPLLTPDISKSNELAAKRQEIDMRPLIIGLQLHLHIHNFPVLAPYAVPLNFN